MSVSVLGMINNARSRLSVSRGPAPFGGAQVPRWHSLRFWPCQLLLQHRRPRRGSGSIHWVTGLGKLVNVAARNPVNHWIPDLSCFSGESFVRTEVVRAAESSSKRNNSGSAEVCTYDPNLPSLSDCVPSSLTSPRLLVPGSERRQLV